MKVIKIGGSIIDDRDALMAFLKEFVKISGQKVLVHGGGTIATGIGKRLGIEPNMIDGRRVTDAKTIDLVNMVYGGLVNKSIVAELQGLGIDAIGLSGADGNIIQSKIRPKEPIDFGYVGDIEKVNSMFLESLIDSGKTPVFCSLTHDREGQMLNTNADTIAAEVAIALSKDYNVELFYCFDKVGVLQDINDTESLIEEINEELLLKLKEDKVINDGMLPKIDNSFDALRRGVAVVKIGHHTNLISENKLTKMVL